MHGRSRRWPPPLHALALYSATIVLEVPVMFTRMLIALTVGVLLLLLSGHSTAGASWLLELGLLPSLWALLALLTPIGGGWWWRQNLGGRKPSERERLAYEDAIDLLRSHASTSLPTPRSWFVIDTPELDAAVCGDALMLSRGLIEGEHLAAVLAHELGHLASSDGSLTAALNRLVVNPPPRTADQERQQRDGPELVLLAPERVILTIFGIRAIAWAIRGILSFARGGLGLRITASLWGAYWRAREYTADEYAAGLGQAEELADFLEIHALIHDHAVPFIWLSEHTHPPTELRVDRLREGSTQPPAPAGRQIEPASPPSPPGPPAASPHAISRCASSS